MSKMSYRQRADLAEALAMAMEPEAWARVNSADKTEAKEDDGARVVRAIRHSVAAMMLLDREGLI